MKELTVLSFGGGQDSTTLLYLYIYDPHFAKLFTKGDLIVIMSNTGDEHPATYTHVKYIELFCKFYNIPFFFITNDMGYHLKTWPTLRDQWKRNNTIQSVAFPKSCTDNLKIKPIYNFLADYVNKQYLSNSSTPYRKKALYDFKEKYGKIRVILGIAASEEKRVMHESKTPKKWMRECIERSYPLITLKMDRSACQEYISFLGHAIPMPSNCKLCPYLSKQEVLWLHRFLPEDFVAWVGFERAKIDNNQSVSNNLGVFGKKLLPQILEECKKIYGHWSNERLNEYKMSHGHCVKSKY